MKFDQALPGYESIVVSRRNGADAHSCSSSHGGTPVRLHPCDGSACPG